MDGFKIQSKNDLLNLLDITDDSFQQIIANKSKAYNVYAKHKSNGIRLIHSINNDHKLYALQKRLNLKFTQTFLFPDCVIGFRKNKSYFDFLTPHILNIKQRYFLRLDIANFFDSIEINDIKESLVYYVDESISKEEKDEILNIILEIITLNNKVIQGAITSPIISNLVFRSLDIRIEKYCKKLDIKYTRYADDMLFSSSKSYIHNYRFSNAIKAIIADKNFNLNIKKSLKYKDEISLNGYVVGTDIRLSRKRYKKINELIYKMNKTSFTGFTSRPRKYRTKNQLAGYRAFLIQAVRYTTDSNKRSKINNKIDCIEKLINKYCI